MRAVVLDYETQRLRAGLVAEPEPPGRGEVRFRVHEVGVCGTDRALAAFRIGRPPAGERQLVIGHEALGQVLDTGAGVRNLNRGDWVAPMVRRACFPACGSCVRGRRDLCLSGRYTERGIIGRHGYFAETAVDAASDLVRVPLMHLEYAVLIEPLSVVEKALERAMEVHPGEPSRALVLGAGALGILAALALQARGFSVEVFSLEPPDHPRAAMIRSQRIAYQTTLDPDHPADLIFEACGDASAAFAALHALAPLGVMVVLGAGDGAGAVPFLRMIVNNQSVVGCVNASPSSYQLAVEDLASFDPAVLRAMIERRKFSDFESSILGPPARAAKLVHVIRE